MKHIFLNLKRFDVPVKEGGVNRLAPIAGWGRAVVEGIQEQTDPGLSERLSGGRLTRRQFRSLYQQPPCGGRACSGG